MSDKPDLIEVVIDEILANAEFIREYELWEDMSCLEMIKILTLIELLQKAQLEPNERLSAWRRISGRKLQYPEESVLWTTLDDLSDFLDIQLV